MKTVPIGRMTSRKALSAPVVAAASTSSPSGATMRASVNPMTDWVARASTTGQASCNRVRKDTGVADERADGAVMSEPLRAASEPRRRDRGPLLCDPESGWPTSFRGDRLVARGRSPGWRLRGGRGERRALAARGEGSAGGEGRGAEEQAAPEGDHQRRQAEVVLAHAGQQGEQGAEHRGDHAGEGDPACGRGAARLAERQADAAVRQRERPGSEEQDVAVLVGRPVLREPKHEHHRAEQAGDEAEESGEAAEERARGAARPEQTTTQGRRADAPGGDVTQARDARAEGETDQPEARHPAGRRLSGGRTLGLREHPRGAHQGDAPFATLEGDLVEGGGELVRHPELLEARRHLIREAAEGDVEPDVQPQVLGGEALRVLAKRQAAGLLEAAPQRPSEDLVEHVPDARGAVVLVVVVVVEAVLGAGVLLEEPRQLEGLLAREIEILRDEGALLCLVVSEGPLQIRDAEPVAEAARHEVFDALQPVEEERAEVVDPGVIAPLEEQGGVPKPREGVVSRAHGEQGHAGGRLRGLRREAAASRGRGGGADAQERRAEEAGAADEREGDEEGTSQLFHGLRGSFTLAGWSGQWGRARGAHRPPGWERKWASERIVHESADLSGYPDGRLCLHCTRSRHPGWGTWIWGSCCASSTCSRGWTGRPGRRS